ncbi:MAG: hypothetical protein ACM37W_23590 [Actinomycetota bacterium]
MHRKTQRQTVNSQPSTVGAGLAQNACHPAKNLGTKLASWQPTATQNYYQLRR